MRRVLAPLLAAMLLLMSVMPAAAAKPEIEHFDEAFTEEYPAGELCDFDVRLDFVDQSHVITFPTADDGSQRLILGGRLRVTVTNLDDDVSAHYNISGPGKYRFVGDRLFVAGGGPWLLYLFAGDDGGPGIWFTRGYVALEVDLATGVIVASTMPRNVIDVCRVLGGAAATES